MYFSANLCRWGILTLPLLVGENPECIEIAWIVSSTPVLMLIDCNVAFVLLIYFSLHFIFGFPTSMFCSVLCCHMLLNSHRLTLASIFLLTIPALHLVSPKLYRFIFSMIAILFAATNKQTDVTNILTLDLTLTRLYIHTEVLICYTCTDRR